MKEKYKKLFSDFIVFCTIVFMVIIVVGVLALTVIGGTTIIKDYKHIDDRQLCYNQKSLEMHTDLQYTIQSIGYIETDSISKVDVLKMLGKLDK